MAEIFVYTFYAYLVIGLLFALWFVFKGVQKVDTGMKDVKWILRLQPHWMEGEVPMCSDL